MDGKESEYCSSTQLENLHPALPLSTRIAVVGGGPSGLAAAVALTKLGYEHVTVLEREPTVGGMCASAVVEGRVYDLGGQVLARESCPTLRTLMTEMEIEMEDMTQHRLSRIDCSTGKYEDLQIAAAYISLMPCTAKLQADAAATGNLGVHALSDLAHQPADEYLRKRGIANGVPVAVANGYTASGYGYPAEMPYAYVHEFARTSMLGKIWRVKGGYCSFWEKLANSLPDVRCNVEVTSIDRLGDKVEVSISTNSKRLKLEFDKLIMTGSIAYPQHNPTYRSQSLLHPGDGGTSNCRPGILNFTAEELHLFSKVRTIEYYTTVLKISGLDLPVGFYYPNIYSDDPNTIGHPVAMQRFFPDSDIYLFWSYGNAQVTQKEVTELLLENVQNMGGTVLDFVLQRKWNYFPHVSSTDMAEGFYDKMNELQGKNNTFYLGALVAFELTERNVSYAFNLVSRYFGSTKARPYVKKLIPLPGPIMAKNGTQLERKYRIEELDDLPDVEFPDLLSLDSYLSFYAKHKVVGEKVLYTWLDDQGKEADKRTFADLNMRASIVAHRLLTEKVPLKAGDRVLLLHPPGLDFIEAFFGCLRARIVPVPLIPPDPRQRGGQALAKVENVAKACDAKVILSTYAYHTAVRAGLVRNMLCPSNKAIPNWPSLPWLHTDSWTSRGKTPWNWLFSRSPSFNGSLSPRETAFEREKLHTVPRLSLPSDRAPFKPKSGSRFPKSVDLKNEKSVHPIMSPRSVIRSPQEDVSSDEDDKQVLDLDFGPPPKPSDVCFLQFTSGSTGDSKGVMISHGGLIHNVKLMRSEYRSTSKTVLVSWLPQYHDMGLIGGLFTALVSGGTAVLFSPTTFIRKPMLWLETMDKYKCTHSAGPNFAFELIVKRYEQLKAAGAEPSYDLSSLRFLMASAEPLRHKTMRSFLELLRGTGLREQVLAPGYGLAENCVFVCVAYGREEPIRVDWQGRVCCGYPQKGNKDMDIRIVDPTTFEEKDAGVEGEIWVHSPSMGVSYWGQEELGEKTFSNSISNADAEDKERKFLRTGDLGRVLDGKLFVTGRIKDLIIVRGRNFYPADIEKVVENSSDGLRPGCCAVFSAPHNLLQEKGVTQPGAIEDAGIVVVAELRDEKKFDAKLPNLIKASVAEEYGLEVAHVSLIKPRTIAKTTSGKIRRLECLRRFAENQLETVKVPIPSKRHLRRWDSAPLFRRSTNDMSNLQIFSPHSPLSNSGIPFKQDIANFLIKVVAERTRMPANKISVDESFSFYSIDSVGIVWAAQKLSDFLGVHVAAIDIYTAGCISELAETSESLVRKSRSSSCTTPRQPPTPLTPRTDSSTAPSKRVIVRFLVELVAERTGIPAHEISTTENLTAYNIDSVGVVWAAQKLSERLGVHVAAIDVYTAGCIADLAETAEALVNKAKPSENTSIEQSLLVDTQSFQSDFLEGEALTDDELSYSLEPSLSRRIAISSLQAVGILYIATLLLIPAAFIYGCVTTLTIKPSTNSLILSVSLVPLAWVTYMGVIALIISIFGTCILQPNFAFGFAIPLWSVRYVKWWTLYRLQEFASTFLAVHLRGTVFLTWWFRLLGAHIGEGVHLDTTDITDPGLLFVGNNVVIEEGATVQCHEVKGGIVYFRPVKINNEARVGPFSVIQRGTTVDVGGSITPLGKTDVGQRVFASISNLSAPKASEKMYSSIMKGMQQVFGLYLVGLISTAAAVVAYLPFLWFATKLEIFVEADRNGRNFAAGCMLFALTATFPWALVGVAPVLAFEHSSVLLHFLLNTLERRKLIVLFFTFGVAYFIYGVMLSIFTIAMKWYLIGSLDVKKKSKMSCSSKQFFRIWLVHTLLRFTHLKFVSLLSGTEATCIYLRGLGAKIGNLASIRGVNALLDPDLINVGPGSHLGDFAKIITSVYHNDSTISLGKVTIGAGCMVGAQSVVMPGATLEDQSWLGAMSVAPANSVLQSGGVYVGVDSPVKIYQRNAQGVRVPANSDGGEKDYRIEQMDPLYQQIVANLSASIAKTTLSVEARYFHRLGVGGKGVIRFLDTLPGFPQHEIFAPGKAYPVIVRHSNSLSGDDDARMDARGAALRILQPSCETDVDAALLDLTLKTGKGFYARNLIEFVSYLTKNQEARLKHMEQFPHTGQMIWDSLKDCNSYTEMHYYSNIVRLFRCEDRECYIKFRMRPADLQIDEDQGRVQPHGVLPPETGAIPRSEGDDRPLRFLGQDFKTRVNSPEGVKYVFQVQLRPISNSAQEIEEALDCTKPWDEKLYPYANIAEVHLTEVLDDEVVQKMRFNPRNGPSSIGMIPARTASQSASMDHGRSLAYDIAQYLRNGMALPPAWQKLLKKADQQVPMSTEGNPVGVGGCPAMSGCLPANVQVSPVPHMTITTKEQGKQEVDKWELAMIRFFQPLLHTTIPFMLMSLSFYPALVALAFVGSKFGQDCMVNLLPVAYVFSGTTFAAASILARKILVGQTKDGDKSDLWGMKSLCDTTWQSINVILNSTFLMLGKGSLLTTWYLRSMGASVCSSAYIDTNYALNPDLLSIGAGSTVGHNALLFGHLYEGGRVEFKSNMIGNYASIGTRALILPGLKMHDDSQLAALGLGMKDEVIVAY